MIDYDPVVAQAMLALVESGENIERICKMEGFPHKGIFYQWLKTSEQLQNDYARAREYRADARFDRIDTIGDALLSGEITSDMARVLIDKEKWQAGKENPKRYGDKQQIEQTTTVNVNIDDRRALARQQARAMLEAAAKRMTIDHTVDADKAD